MMLLRNPTETIELWRVNGDCRVEILREPLPPYKGLSESVLLNIAVCVSNADVHSHHEVLWHQ